MFKVSYNGPHPTPVTVFNAIKFNKGIGPALAARLTKGETLTLDLPAQSVEALRIIPGITLTPCDRPEPAPVAPAAPVTPAAPVQAGDLGGILAGLVAANLEEQIVNLIRKHSSTPAEVHLTVDNAGRTFEHVGAMHHRLPTVLAAVASRVNVMLVGPAGSGKTTMARKIAEALGVPFYYTGALDSPYKLMGFIDAQGRTVRTPFREAFEHGGLFLYDEIDGSLPGAVLPFNAAIDNRVCDFPDGIIEAHPDFYPVASANTFGLGASREYVGRNQLDAASLDRFATIEIDYDPGLEAALVGLPRPAAAPKPDTVDPVPDEGKSGIVAGWLSHVTAVRKAIMKLEVRHIVSPRATLNGSKLLLAGLPFDLVERAVIYKGLKADTVTKIKEAI